MTESRQVTVHIVNAFVDGDIGGNPAGVVVDASRLSSAQKLKVAQSVGLSETAFVSTSAVATLRLEFYTPSRQIAHCGHATVATFSLLRQLGVLRDGKHSKETIDGIRTVILESDMAFMEQRAPSFTYIDRASALGDRVLRSLALADRQLLAGRAPCVVNTGNSFLLLAVDSAATLSDMRPDLPAINEISEELELIGFYPFTLATKRPGRHAAARMFAPRYGIAEEAGTGMAAGPLACWLHQELGMGGASYLLEQGWFMQPPSPCAITVNLTLEESAIAGLLAGGRAKTMRTVGVDL
jgi:PhzF family phenazine biosynthesis protein